MKYIKALYAGFIGLLLAACQVEQWEGMEGGFQISLGEDVTVTTKSTPAELGKPVKEQFSLKIVKESTGSTLYDGTFTSDQIPASAGLYTVTATYGNNPLLGLDTPYYKGEEAGVEVTEGETRTVNLSCKVANALTSVTYEEPEKFDALFSSYGLKVSVDNQFVTINNNNAQKSAYYRAGTIPTFQFVGTLKDNGQAVSMTLEDDKLKNADTFGAGKHCKLTLKVKPATSGVILTVAKVEVENVTISETIPVEWLPKPKIEAEGFEGNSLSFAETESKAATVKLNTATALQDLKIKFNFADPQFAAFNQEYQLSTLSEDTRKDLEEKLGITLPAIGDSSPSIQLDNLIARLQTNAGEATANTIELDAQANGRWSHEDAEANRSYTLNCNKPEFTVSAYPGNIWTKEFTMNALMKEQVMSGDFAKLSSDMTYQFSTNNKDWSNLGEDLRKADLTPGTTYYIRGLYRGAIASEAVEVKTYPIIELENGDMEDWNEEERGYYYNANIFDRNPDKLRTYYPWKESSYWNTNNDFTTRHRDASTAAFSTVYRYNSFPAVSYTKNANTGNFAAELRNTAAGRGNTSPTSSSYDFNNVPGELFIGDITVTTGGTDAIPKGDHYDINQGRNFNSRPTGIRFYYKYVPYTTDSWKAYIVLYDESNNIIAENTVTNGNAVNSYQEFNIPFNYIEDPNIVPAKIYIYFASSIYSGSSLPYHSTDVTTWYENSQRTDKTLSGSILTIDDISLIYDK